MRFPHGHLIPFFFFISLLKISAANAILDPSDFLALQSIRASLFDLPGSVFFSTWDFTADPCSTFSGLLCSNNRVTSLSLGDPRAGTPGLSGHLPHSLSLLSSLRSFSLLPGRVSGPLPHSLSLLPNLQFLALSHNYLSGPIPNLSPLTHLRTLDLSSNLLSGPIPPLPPTLNNLFLSHNHLSGPIPKLQHIPLIRLDLHRNNLSGKISVLPSSLKSVSLKSNHLTGGITNALMNVYGLSFLDLSCNMLTGAIPGRVFGMPATEGIYLQRNLFSEEVRIEGKVVAREVDLSYNRLIGRVPVGLAEAERVYLNFNGFVGKVPGRYSERVRSGGMKVLFLQRNYLTGMEVEVGEVPRNVALCLQLNCMVPPEGNVCPVRGGRWARRPGERVPRTEEWMTRIRLFGVLFSVFWFWSGLV